MKVLLTGASGNLGQDILRVFTDAGHDVVTTDRTELDITSIADVEEKVAAVNPDVIINCAAYNFVDKIEDPAVYPIAYAVNAKGPKNLAAAARKHGIWLVHYSTDYVFAGDKPEGYREDDAPNPISKYGETKVAGEQFVIDSRAQAYIIRLSKIFGRPGISEASKPSFVSLMLRLAKEKPSLQIVDEEVGSPTYTLDIARETLRMLDAHVPPGIYHVVNDGPGVTWYRFAEEIFSLTGITTPRTPVPSSAFPRAATAPKFAQLLNTKLPPLRPRSDALRDFLGLRT